MTHRELIARLATKRSLPLASARVAVNVLVNCWREALVAGERVELRRFGVLHTRLLNARTNLHPQSGQWSLLPTRRAPAFRVSPEWLARLNAQPFLPAASSRLVPSDDSPRT